LNLPKAQREDIKSLQIYDATGKIVGNELNRNTFRTNIDLISLDLPILPSGNYFLEVKLSDKILNYRFVVM
jgi:hypothetical protein